MHSFNILIAGTPLTGKTAFIERVCGRQFPIQNALAAPTHAEPAHIAPEHIVSLNTTHGNVDLSLVEKSGHLGYETADGVITMIDNTPHSQVFAQYIADNFHGPVVICRSMHDLPVSFSTCTLDTIDISARTGYNLFAPLSSMLQVLMGVNAHILSINNNYNEIPPLELSHDILAGVPDHVVIPEPEYIAKIYNINIAGVEYTMSYQPRELLVDFTRGVFSIKF